MTTDVSAPFSLTEFQQDLATVNKRKLLQWADSPLCVAFLCNQAGQEQLALIQLGQQSCYAASTSTETLKALFKDASLEQGCELRVRSLSLSELARNAHLAHAGIHLSNEQVALSFAGPIIALLGVTAVVQDLQGNEAVYQVEAFPFGSPDDTGALPYGSVQLWRQAELEFNADYNPGDTAPLHVFDDQLDWSTPRLPALPKNATPLSTLPAAAQAAFDRMRTPPLPTWDETQAKPATAKHSYQNVLIEADNLGGYRQLRALFDEKFVPAASEVTLTINKAAKLDEEPANSPEHWEIKAGFTTPLGIKAEFDADWIEAALCKANPELPDTPGTHQVSPALREHIVNQLTWTAFQRGRSFNLGLFYEDLAGLLPGPLCNSTAPFQPDYTDRRFPCLARWCCGEHEVPVLLLGQEGRNYICKPLQDQDIPARDVPTLIPNRSELIYPESQVMTLTPAFDKLAIPTSLIDFPAHWYQGIRVSDQYLLSKLAASMRVNNLLSEFQAVDEGTRNNTLKWVITGCALALIGLVVFAGAF